MAANKLLTVFNDQGKVVKEVTITEAEHEKFLNTIADAEWPTWSDTSLMPVQVYLIEDIHGMIHTLNITPVTWSRADEVQK